MVNEAREKSDAMTESLFATNEQARQILEEKLKDLQRQNIKLEQSFRDKDRQITDLGKEVSSLTQANQDLEMQIKKSADLIEVEITKSNKVSLL